MSEFTPGIYEVVSSVVAIRRQPRIVEYQDPKGKLVTNQVGRLSAGTKRAVYDIYTDDNNFTWGRVSAHDSAGIAEWTCIKGLNREYMKFLEPLKQHEPPPRTDLDTLFERIKKLEARVRVLENGKTL
jgi:hypothetical protein